MITKVIIIRGYLVKLDNLLANIIIDKILPNLKYLSQKISLYQDLINNSLLLLRSSNLLLTQ